MPTSWSGDPPDTGAADDGACALCGGQPICAGLGLLRQELPVDHPQFGKLVRCPQLPVDTERRDRLRKIGNLDALADKRFDTFTTEVPMHTPAQTQSLRMALSVAEEYAQEPDGWLLLQGTYGCGKTHLAAAVANARLDREEAVIFITTPDLLDHLRSTYGPTSEIGYDALFDRVKNAPLLVLDDLGTENPSPWAQEKLFQLLNHRYTRRLATVITTNVVLETLDPRIRSRLLDNQLLRRVVIQAPDYRTPVQAQPDLLSDLSLYKDMRFENFDIRIGVDAEQSANLRRAATIAYEYAQRPQGWLLLMGSYGSGKTHLAAAVANVQQDQGREVQFVTVPDLLDYLRTGFKAEGSDSFEQRFQNVRTAALLVLDDLGTENATAFAREKLFQIFNYRYLTRLPTVITTSKTLEDFDERLQTRLLDRRMCYTFSILAPAYSIRLRNRSS